MPAAIRTAGIISKPRSEQAARILPVLLPWLAQRGIAARIDTETAAYLGRTDGVPRPQTPEGTQILIVLGGDGTLLSGARAVGGRDIPLFAVNVGGLGFLTAITVDEIYPELERALAGEYSVERRRMLSGELWRGDLKIASHEALNDITISKAEIARMIDLEMHVDAHFVCVYRADGLVIATPTGSTAYSLSAGGPIVYPTVASLSITPICPHTLMHRPVIVPDDKVIEVINRSDDTSYLTVDGQVGEILKPGDRVLCRRSDHSIGLIRPPKMFFFDVLREKLKWGDR